MSPSLKNGFPVKTKTKTISTQLSHLVLDSKVGPLQASVLDEFNRHTAFLESSEGLFMCGSNDLLQPLVGRRYHVLVARQNLKSQEVQVKSEQRLRHFCLEINLNLSKKSCFNVKFGTDLTRNTIQYNFVKTRHFKKKTSKFSVSK